MDRDNALHNALDRLLPLSRVVHCAGDGHNGNGLKADVTARIVNVHFWCGRRSYPIATVGIRFGFDLLHWALVAGGWRLLALAVGAILFHGRGGIEGFGGGVGAAEKGGSEKKASRRSAEEIGRGEGRRRGRRETSFPG